MTGTASEGALLGSLVGAHVVEVGLVAGGALLGPTRGATWVVKGRVAGGATIASTYTGSGSGIITTCNGGIAIPATLTVVVTGLGPCTCLTGSYTITYSATLGYWTSAPMTMCSIINQTIQMHCAAGGH